MTLRVSASLDVALRAPPSPQPSPGPGNQKGQSERENTPGERKAFRVIFPGSGLLPPLWTLSI